MKKLLSFSLPVITAIFIIFIAGVFYGRCTSGTTAPINLEQPIATSDLSTQKVINGKINVNTATIEDLLYVPGIGEATAQKIVAYREAHGPFAKLEDLENVSGIGPKKIEQFSAYLTTGG